MDRETDKEMKVYVFQTDNRKLPPDYPFDFIPMSIEGNRKVCGVMGWHYEFKEMNPNYYSGNHPAIGKIYMVRDFLLEKKAELGGDVFMVFLDTDAWIQDASRLRDLLTDMCKEEYLYKRGAFSRDPYIRKNTYVNSGSFILRMDKGAIELYDELLEHIKVEPRYMKEWPWDQVYVSNYVWEHREEFLIFRPDMLNSGYGKILRHNWHKTSRKIRDDLYYLCCYPVVVNEIRFNGWDMNELDTEEYPNVAEKGYDYMDFE